MQPATGLRTKAQYNYLSTTLYFQKKMSQSNYNITFFNIFSTVILVCDVKREFMLDRSLISSRPFMATINVFLCLLGASRAASLFIDPYSLSLVSINFPLTNKCPISNIASVPNTTMANSHKIKWLHGNKPQE